MANCSISGCDKKAIGRGWCGMHYRRWQKHGDPLTVKQVQMHGVTLFERFWVNVALGPNCWEWSAGRDPNGYGRIGIGETPILAHRVSYELAHGVKLAPSQHIMHTCDNPSCVRPSHLQLGDHAANMADKVKKGRHVYGTSKGEAHGCAKLSDEMVRDIRASTMKGKDLAVIYRVSATTISDIRNRRVWKHLD